MPSDPSSTAVTPPPIESLPVPPPRVLRVLVAEDNRVNRIVVERMLAKLGHDVRSVENGAQAVAALEHERFDAVLMDCQMPEMDGLEAARLIRARQPDGPPIIAITAGSIKELREARKAGMSAFLPKPFGLDTLRATLDRLCPAGPQDVSPADVVVQTPAGPPTG